MATESRRDTAAVLLGGVAALLLMAPVAVADARSLRVDTGTAPAPPVHAAGHGEVPGQPPPSGPPGRAEDTDPFTLDELAAGEVDPVRYDAFWAAQRDAILSAPCPGALGGAATRVTVHVGTDERWAAELEAASRAHARGCGDG